MKLAWMIGVITALAPAAEAAQSLPRVTANTCGDPGVPRDVQLRAELIAGRIFADVGVPVQWLDCRHSRSTDDKATITFGIRLHSEESPIVWRGALGVMIREKDGPVIHIFYPRVASLSRLRPGLSGVMLGYVFAHEMAHILQGEARHSATGILKPHWAEAELNQMADGRLKFAAEDVMLIRRWVAAKTAELRLGAIR